VDGGAGYGRVILNYFILFFILQAWMAVRGMGVWVQEQLLARRCDGWSVT
jgi:hypothetical protein